VLVVLALPFVLALVLPLALVAAILYFLHRLAVYLLVWALWLPKRALKNKVYKLC